MSFGRPYSEATTVLCLRASPKLLSFSVFPKRQEYNLACHTDGPLTLSWLQWKQKALADVSSMPLHC